MTKAQVKFQKYRYKNDGRTERQKLSPSAFLRKAGEQLSIDIYLQLKTSFILKDDEVHYETAPNSISSVLVKYMKTEYFLHGGSDFASDFPSRQAC